MTVSPASSFHRVRLLFACAIVGALCVGNSSLFAQLPNVFEDSQAPAKASAAKLVVETTLTTDRLAAGAVANLSVTVKIPSGFALYSMDPSSPQPAKIQLSETPGLQPVGDFVADHPAKRSFDAIFKKDLEKYTRQVTWTQSLRIVDPQAAAVRGTFTGVYCSTGEGGNCIRAEEDFDVTLSERPADAATGNATAGVETATHTYEVVETPEYNGQTGPATLRVMLSPRDAKVGETVAVMASMVLGEGWHTYSNTQKGSQGTQFKLVKAKGLTPIGEDFTADQMPKDVTSADGGKTQEHAEKVVWTRQFRVDDAAYGIDGSVRYVVCNDNRCLQPKTVSFGLGDLTGAGEVPENLPAENDVLSQVTLKKTADTQNLPYYLGLAFLGGFILNFMPCVLPVVAIKVMGFVQHAGQRRGHIFALNAAYAVGVISVFLLLATLASAPQLIGQFAAWSGVDLFEQLGLGTGPSKWGGLFQSPAFTAGMAIVVFIMGLSLLGVYEIPIPGMVGSAAGSTRQEGITGAILMGVFTTLLATPCTGPFLTTTLGWSLQQPISVAYMVWGVMGLGMASPYLLFGLVPGAVALLPKPGPWMVYLKQFAGFVLMGTVLWLMQSLKTDYILPLLVGLLGVALACWMFGMVQYSTTRGKLPVVSVAALSLAGASLYFAHGMTQESENRLDWKPFSTARVNELVGERKTVLIDFTADWCANCKLNERIALNTKKTKALVDDHGVVTLLADFTNPSEEIQEWLDRFGVVGIPLTVIFPADAPNEPIVLDGVYSQRTLLKNLEQAVSKNENAVSGDGGEENATAQIPTAAATR